ncbi:unnamed protein product [Caenorhabditis angaria]|uniref:ethanolamine-phosphate cytidylyltransferase n=1 Tax=Caenorhabditis angaria TaxID=860376 RepID=A0A9P1IXZ3_9PELO|nr:unnamed protein product [Caenorhabditis angaria]
MSRTITNLAPDGTPKGSRVWVDGCFDIFQYANAQLSFAAKQYGKRLIVGIHNDDEVEDNKNLPIFCEEDRYRLMSSLKWVDEVVEDVPFTTTIASLNQLDCDFCLITDPPMTNMEGENRQADIAKTNRHKKIDIVGLLTENEVIGRIFLQNSTHHFHWKYLFERKYIIEQYAMKDFAPYTKIRTFSDNQLTELTIGRNPQPTDKIVYVTGEFDIFNVSHLSLLENAKELGNYLIVGLISDEDINNNRGSNFPITNLFERLITLASTQVVDEVIVNVPTCITTQLMKMLNINFVVEGITNENIDYSEAKNMGIFAKVDFDSEETTQNIVDRINSLRHDADNGEIETYRDVPTNNQQ